MKFAALHVAASIDTTIVVVVAMVVVVVDVTITAIAAHPPVTMTVTAVTGVVMTTALVASIDMPRLAVKTAIAAVAGMTDVVVVATTIERVAARATMPDMVTRRLQGMLATHTEVESLMPVLMIGSPVDDMRSADMFRFGALSQVMRSILSLCSLGLGHSILQLLRLPQIALDPCSDLILNFVIPDLLSSDGRLRTGAGNASDRRNSFYTKSLRFLLWMGGTAVSG